ncbi:hypothetical protein [Winogradskyella bathintestinalis]|uniref:PH domain-containing protein n=1 Tax=Winogradskyella bathintestinalis TaxID=3035208 RepID=A0ABT7ZY08_9FLAO|nr:hypothetical protein [Winogradskyella bathintestinalis]MDN3493719.1 hypothetical protein [Winogradskyella bathintestinalis]
MRIDNRNIKNTIISIYFLLVATAILLATVFKSFNFFESSSIYIIIGLLIAVVIVHFVARYFEYDSDGAKIVITNSGLIVTEYLNYREKKLDIVKRKLIGFKISNYLFYRALIIVIEQKDGTLLKERFNITLLKRRKLKYVKQSLRKIIKENLKHKEV